MPITMTPQRNGLLLSIIYKGQYYKKLYLGYTRAEAKQDFKEYVKEENGKIITEKPNQFRKMVARVAKKLSKSIDPDDSVLLQYCITRIRRESFLA